MKYEWKKQERDLYGTKEKPVVVKVPLQSFLMLKGEGDPNKEDFSQRVGTLYSLAYPLKMRYKARYAGETESIKDLEYSEYTVFPLEGIWTSADAADTLNKDSFRYTIMIRQPAFVTKELFEEVYEEVKKKKKNPLLEEVIFGMAEDGLCIQMLHKGSFDLEAETFAKMDAFAKENGFKRRAHDHREIYLTNAQKTVPEKKRTILRYPITSI